MRTSSRVSVAITTIPGREHLLQRAVQSVLRQTVLPVELHVQVDKDRRGAAWARNEALTLVTTEWVCWLDDDDELLPEHIETMLAGADESEADLIYTYAEFVGGRDPLAIRIGEDFVPEPIDVPWSLVAETSLRKYGNFIPVTNMVRTEAMRAVGGFPEPGTFGDRPSSDCEDYGLLLRLLNAGYRFYHVCGVRTWRYHYHDANTGGRA